MGPISSKEGCTYTKALFVSTNPCRRQVPRRNPATTNAAPNSVASTQQRRSQQTNENGFGNQPYTTLPIRQQPTPWLFRMLGAPMACVNVPAGGCIHAVPLTHQTSHTGGPQRHVPRPTQWPAPPNGWTNCPVQVQMRLVASLISNLLHGYVPKNAHVSPHNAPLPTKQNPRREYTHTHTHTKNSGVGRVPGIVVHSARAITLGPSQCCFLRVSTSNVSNKPSATCKP